jgi:hypothetical protein
MKRRMKNKMKAFQLFQAGALVALSLATVQQAALAQASPANNIVTVAVGAADMNAPYDPSSYRVQVLGLVGANRRAQWASRGGTASGAITGFSVPDLPPGGFYPADLSNPSNNPTVISALHHPLYVNCPAANCWGTPGPAAFLTDLGNSSFIHVTDQYVGSTANNRYTLGTQAVVLYNVSRTPTVTLFQQDFLNIVHAGAAAFGTGLGHIYHVFVQQGQDVCFASNQCYSPDFPPAFDFCAFHSAVTFSDIGHVIFTVEPFQPVPGCAVPQPSPNGALIDSTASVLSHEVFETITDPNLNAWFVRGSLDLFGAEIGDICQNTTGAFAVTSINGKNYEVQPEYSNLFHGCTFSPTSPPQ